jgi:hypothetical protein
MRDGGALVPAQIIPADFKDGALLLSSGVLVQSTFRSGLGRLRNVARRFENFSPRIYFSQQDDPSILGARRGPVRRLVRSASFIQSTDPIPPPATDPRPRQDF